MRLFQSQFESPLGNLTAICSINGLCLLTFQEEKDFIKPFLLKISQYYQNITISKTSHPHLIETSAWLKHYFNKGQSKSSDKTKPKAPALDLIGTDFSKQTWQALQTVRKSELKSYGWLSEKIQNPKAVRAVGRAVGANPIAILIPCHRIVGSDGSLTGFRSGLWRKEWLLKHEGIQIGNA